MIGNDIVDLAFARKSSNWQRPRWLLKLFSRAEREFILAQKNPEHFVWLFWSMKESAYKIVVQQEKQRFFAPKKLHCTIKQLDGQSCQGQVRYQSKIFITQSTSNEQFIYSLALPGQRPGYPTDQAPSTVSETFFRPVNAPKHWMYHKISAQLSQEARFSDGALRIKKNKLGIPRLFCNETQQSLSLSISHHGRYGAYALVDP